MRDLLTAQGYDDRGQPTRVLARSAMAQTLWQARPGGNRPRLMAARRVIGPLLLPLAIVAAVALTRSATLTIATAFIITFVCLKYFAARQHGAPTFTPDPRHDRLPQLLAAHRCCGACGYDMRSSEPEDDGRALCPECGAAWHSDRWTLANADIYAGSLLARTLVGASRYSALNIDDRGVPLSTPIFSPLRWIGEFLRPTGLPNLAQPARRSRIKRLIVVLVLVTPVLAGVNVLSYWIADPHDRTLFVTVSAVITGFAMLFGLVFAWWPNFNPQHARKEVIGKGICVNCRQTFATPPFAKPGTFDGCTPCACCGRAWTLPVKPVWRTTW